MHYIETGHKLPRARNSRRVRDIEPSATVPFAGGAIPKVRCRHVLVGRSPKIIKITEARQQHFHPNGIVCNACQHRPQCAA